MKTSHFRPFLQGKSTLDKNPADLLQHGGIKNPADLLQHAGIS